ncbi:MAG TPA: hypothetical protein VKY15_08970 [Acidimicrobiales bacterium]|nr:hypothetical protein [Acidimicrobiales bacterium]
MSNGSVTFQVTSDPVFEVVAPATAASTTSIGQATTAQTSKPLLLEELMAGVLVLVGGLLLAWLHLRRRRA